MIRLWVVAVIIATNGLHLALESVQTINLKFYLIFLLNIAIYSLITLLILFFTVFTYKTDYRIHGGEQSIWTQTSNELSLLHHSTSNLESDDVRYGINFNTQRISKESFWQIFRKNRKGFDKNSSKRTIDYFQSLYLTSLIVCSVWAYNRYISLKHKQKTDEYFDEIDFKTKSKKYTVNEVVSDFEFSIYCLLPLRTVSRVWGKLNSVQLPVHMRKTILNAYIKSFGCNLDEALEQDLTQYKNLNEFFRRSLKPGVRPIATTKGIVSPADGTVLHFGKVTNGRVEQVKGITYSLTKFLGPQNWSQNHNEKQIHNSFEYQKNLLINKSGIKTELYSCVVYLSPGDYHRFHSAADWTVDFRRHFAGHLLSVRPAFVSGFPNIFTINERVVYSGQWEYGFFSMTAVGATNVGTVKVYFDKDLVTNEKNWTSGEYHDLAMNESVEFNKGQAFGEFNLGSTIVLIFEAPENFEFTVKTGQTIKYGELLAKI